MASKLFDQVAQVWQNSKQITTKTKPDSVFMTIRFLSLDPDGFLAACDANRMQGLPEWAALSFLKHASTTKNPPRNKYPKKLIEGKKLTDKKKATLKRICRKFNLSEFHGTQVVGLLEMQGFKLECS